MLPSSDTIWTEVTTAVRARERPLGIACLVLVALGASAFFVPPFKQVLFSQVERVSDYIDNRPWWDVGEGERLVSEERFEEAAELLEPLSLEFPARNARHARTLQMQRTLGLLGRSHQALGRKGRALRAYREAVFHDPRNYSNHFQLAQAALALDEPEEAWQEFQEVLSIHPVHTPSLEGVVQIAIDAEDAAGVVEAYRRYLDAVVVRDVEVQLADQTVIAPVVADGRLRTAELVLSLPEGWSGELRLSANDAVPDLEQVELRPALRVGELGESAFDLPVEGELHRSSSMVRNQPVETFHLVLRVPRQPRGVARMIMRLRLLRPVGADLWRTVEGAYATVLDRAGAAAARDRSYVLEAGE